jgi:hypothetical protein
MARETRHGVRTQNKQAYLWKKGAIVPFFIEGGSRHERYGADNLET